MRKIILIATVLVMMSPFVAFAQSSEGYYDRSYIRLSYVKGDVYVQRGQDQGYEQGEVNLVVVEGDKIGTNVGRVEIQLGRRNYLRLDDYTQVDVVNLPRSDSDPTKLHLLSGSIFLRINSLDGEKNFEIHTPDASFYILEEGLCRVDVRDNRETEFSMLSGSAEAAGEEGSVLVRSGEQVVVANGRFISGPVSFYSRRDDFSDWNETRDALYARRLSRTYLPADYSDYEYELADYGRWVNEGSYGYVWVPSLTNYDWRPYYHGRWVWYPIIGWSWVSYEPWGWCTSHYGRWGWRTGLGWYWIPHRNWYWGPAWVHWFWDMDYIGWCPLGYYNYPLVIINNIFYDRYTHNNFPNNSRTLTVVRKDQLQSRRLTQVALDQTRISKIGKISLKSMSPEIRPSIDRHGEIATKAQRILSRENLRSVSKSFNASAKIIAPDGLKSSAIKRSAEPGMSKERTVRSDQIKESDSERAIKKDGSVISRPSLRNEKGAVADRPEQKAVPRDSVRPRLEGESGSRIRSFPSRGSYENESPRPGDKSSAISPPRKNGEKGNIPPFGDQVPPELREKDNGRTVIRKYDSGEPINRVPQDGRSVREQPKSPERNPGSLAPRNNDPERIVKERGRSDEGASSAPGRSLQKERERGVTRTSESLNRSVSRNDVPSFSRQSSPSRIASTPSRKIEPPSRNDSGSSRILNSPSRSSSPPSRSYSLPSPSRSFSAPSRSSSAPSRNSGSSSRSSSPPSRSFSSPSRSSSGSSARSGSSVSSRSSSSSSSGSGGGRIRKKD